MGSLDAAGIPVVTKNSNSFRHLGNQIVATDSVTDTVTAIDSGVALPVRAVGSGSIVGDFGAVTYHEDLVYGTVWMSRTAQARVASDTGNARVALVNLNGNETEAVLVESLSGVVPLTSIRHLGNKLHQSRSDTDTIIERLPDSGVFDLGFPL